MTFTLWDGKVSLINVFPSMPLGTCARTLDSKGAAVHLLYKLPEPLYRGPMSSPVSRVWPMEDPGHVCLAMSVYSIGSSVMLIHKASLPLGHLQTTPAPTIKWGRGKKTAYKEPKLQIHSSSWVVGCPCLLPPPVLRDAAWMFPSPWLTSLWMSNASSGPLGIDLYSGNSWRASVTVWCAFSVIKKMVFPRCAFFVWSEWALYPTSGAWELHSVKRLENVTPRGKKSREMKMPDKR